MCHIVVKVINPNNDYLLPISCNILDFYKVLMLEKSKRDICMIKNTGQKAKNIFKNASIGIVFEKTKA